MGFFTLTSQEQLNCYLEFETPISALLHWVLLTTPSQCELPTFCFTSSPFGSTGMRKQGFWRDEEGGAVGALKEEEKGVSGTWPLKVAGQSGQAPPP